MVAVLLVSPAACSTGDERLTKREYEERVAELVRERGSDANQRYFAVVGQELSTEACADETRALQRALEEIVAEADALRPPAEIEELHDAFVEAAGESVAAVGEAAEDVADGELSCGQPLNDRIYGLPSTDRAIRVIQRLHQRGYVRFVLSD